jgi:hypothetical protein
LNDPKVLNDGGDIKQVHLGGGCSERQGVDNKHGWLRCQIGPAIANGAHEFGDSIQRSIYYNQSRVIYQAPAEWQRIEDEMNNGRIISPASDPKPYSQSDFV